MVSYMIKQGTDYFRCALPSTCTEIKHYISLIKSVWLLYDLNENNIYIMYTYSKHKSLGRYEINPHLPKFCTGCFILSVYPFRHEIFCIQISNPCILSSRNNIKPQYSNHIGMHQNLNNVDVYPSRGTVS